MEIEKIVEEIYSNVGPGQRECVYHKAFEFELRDAGIPYECEVVVPLYYKGQFLSHYRLDLVIDKKCIIELKATKSLKEDDVQQLKRYLKATRISEGYLVNFGDHGTEVKKVTLC
jgi:GxxExxY protein